MKLIADFHIHSKYSRATSKEINFANLQIGARQKGIDVLGTGDATHPRWIKEMREFLMPVESGLYALKDKNIPDEEKTRFIITAEVSCIYKKNERVRKIHTDIIFPSIEAAEKFNGILEKQGFNLISDGRPILGLDAQELLKISLEASPDVLFVPAHCLTPWFSIFGSKSGFDSVEECFGKDGKYIYALETGLSADPSMIWRIPDGQKLTLISNSDAHSTQKLGREANVLDCNRDYQSIIGAIKTKKGFLYTIEFFPQEGKYFNDGHANCKINFDPEQSRRYNQICPVCGQKLVIGVLSRVYDIANKPAGFRPEGAVPFKNIVPLEELLGHVFGKTPSSKFVSQEYQKLLQNFKSEFGILLDEPLEDIKRVSCEEVALGIEKMRQGQVEMEPGYDGIYGRIKSLPHIKNHKTKQERLL